MTVKVFVIEEIAGKTYVRTVPATHAVMTLKDSGFFHPDCHIKVAHGTRQIATVAKYNTQVVLLAGAMKENGVRFSKTRFFKSVVARNDAQKSLAWMK